MPSFKKSIIVITGVVTLACSCSSMATNNLKDAKCDTLIDKSKDDAYVLKNLAAMYANRNCKEFSFNFKNLAATEKRIFKIKFDELDENKKSEIPATESIEVLRLAYRAEKDPGERFKAFKKYRQKLRSSNRREESFSAIKKNHEEVIKKITAKKPEPVYFDIAIESAMIYAKALWSKGQTDAAEKEINKVIEVLNADQPVFNLYYLLAKINEERNVFEAATANYEKAVENYQFTKDKLAGRSPDVVKFDLGKVEWNKAWILYRHGTTEKAEIALKAIAEKSLDPSEKSRAQFFLAKVYKKLDKKAEAEKLLRENTENDFFSFYALASFNELEMPLPSVKSITSNPGEPTFKFDDKLSFLAKKDKDLFTALIENEELEMADMATLVFGKTNTEYVNLGLYLAENAGVYMPLFSGFARLSNNEKKDIFIKHGRLIFPELHVKKVNEMSRKTNISNNLIYSIMKQESGFNPEIRSHADAYGLMQVIPSLAKSLAKKYKVNYKKTEDLFDPMVNIELGTYELKDQVEKQGGQLSLVASAYNAGPTITRTWKNREPISDMYEFIENIPYDETRTYIKLIARNMLFYQRLADPEKEQTFPVEFIRVTN